MGIQGDVLAVEGLIGGSRRFRGVWSRAVGGLDV